MIENAAEQLSPVQEGEVIGGKYQVERILGVGGMGVVVAATHLQLEQRVALKFLRAEARENEEVVERFTREARAAARITSEHVGRVIDVGQLERGDLFMVMEYLEGRDLSEVLQREGRLPPARAVDYILQACEAIAEAHQVGIVHRDLKPANLFLARRVDGTHIVKVLDFGISKVSLTRNADAAATDPSLTNPTAVMGSPLYMSPEQMHSSVRVDARSDIWALGVMLYEMVSGKTPFEAESIPLIHAAILHNDPPPLRERVASIPPRFESILQRCLQKDPAKRYADVAELVNALAPLSPRQGRITVEKVGRLRKAAMSDRPPGRTLAIPDPTSPSSTVTAWGEHRKRVGRRRTGVLVATFLAVAAAAAFYVMKKGNPLARLAPTLAANDGTVAPAATAEAPPATAAAITEPASSAQPTTTAAASADPAAEAAVAAKKEDAARLYKAANAKFTGRDYGSAALLFAQADATFPGAKPRYRAALCYDKLGRREEAIAWYEKFLSGDPDPAAFTAGEIVAARRRLTALKSRTGFAPQPKAHPSASADAKPVEPAASAAPAVEPPTPPTPPPASTDGTHGFGDRE